MVLRVTLIKASLQCLERLCSSPNNACIHGCNVAYTEVPSQSKPGWSCAVIGWRRTSVRWKKNRKYITLCNIYWYPCAWKRSAQNYIGSTRNFVESCVWQRRHSTGHTLLVCLQTEAMSLSPNKFLACVCRYCILMWTGPNEHFFLYISFFWEELHVILRMKLNDLRLLNLSWYFFYILKGCRGLNRVPWYPLNTH